MIDTSQFTGTETYHRFGLFPDVATDGAIHVAKEGGAYWLLDSIVALLRENEWHKKDYFAVAKLSLHGSKADLILDDGNGNLIDGQKIEFTDFPDPTVTFYCSWDGKRWVLMVPSEY